MIEDDFVPKTGSRHIRATSSFIISEPTSDTICYIYWALLGLHYQVTSNNSISITEALPPWGPGTEGRALFWGGWYVAMVYEIWPPELCSPTLPILLKYSYNDGDWWPDLTCGQVVFRHELLETSLKAGRKTCSSFCHWGRQLAYRMYQTFLLYSFSSIRTRHLQDEL